MKTCIVKCWLQSPWSKSRLPTVALSNIINKKYSFSKDLGNGKIIKECLIRFLEKMKFKRVPEIKN